MNSNDRVQMAERALLRAEKSAREMHRQGSNLSAVDAELRIAESWKGLAQEPTTGEPFPGERDEEEI